MKTLTVAEIQIRMKQAKTLEESHYLAVLLCQTLKAKYQGTQYYCYSKK
jgi:hypothetical protein